MSSTASQEGDPSLRQVPQAILLTGDGLRAMSGERFQTLTEMVGGIGLSATVVTSSESAEGHVQDLRGFESIRGEHRALCALSNVVPRHDSSEDGNAVPTVKDVLWNDFYIRLNDRVDTDVGYAGSLADNLIGSSDARDRDLGVTVLAKYHERLAQQGPIDPVDVDAEAAKWQSLLRDEQILSDVADYMNDVKRAVDELIESGRTDLTPFRQSLRAAHASYLDEQ
jgi:hypothetical protein